MRQQLNINKNRPKKSLGQNFIKDPIIAGEFDIKERYFLIGLACIADDFGRIWYNEKAISSSVFHDSLE